MSVKYLGKISSVKFGIGGYQDAMFGISFSFEFDHSGISDHRGTWDPELIECTEHSKWTEADRDRQLAELCRFISKLMKDAKVDDVNKLQGKPVEVTIGGSGFGSIESWRILTEVL